MLLVVIETLIYHLGFIVFLFKKRKKEPASISPMVVAGVFFAANLLLFIGFIVPSLGSVVRYRSIYIIFLVAPLFSGIDCEKFINSIKIKK